MGNPLFQPTPLRGAAELQRWASEKRTLPFFERPLDQFENGVRFVGVCPRWGRGGAAAPNPTSLAKTV